MDSWSKHIGTLLIALAAVVIPVHILVPHDHHFQAVHAPAHQDECTKDKDDGLQEKPHEEPPGNHCYALNELFFDRPVPANLSIAGAVYITLLGKEIPGVTAPSKELERLYYRIPVQDFIRSPEFFCTESPLRAPPQAV